MFFSCQACLKELLGVVKWEAVLLCPVFQEDAGGGTTLKVASNTVTVVICLLL